MKNSLILMLMISLVGHIAAAGMLYVAGAYGVWDEHPRNGIGDQTGDVVRVLWGFTEETQMSIQGTKEHKNVIPAQAGIYGGEGLKPSPTPTARGLDSHFRGNDGQLTEGNMPVVPHEWGVSDAQEFVAPAEPVSPPKPEADKVGLYGRPNSGDKPSYDEETMRGPGLYAYHPVPAEETAARSAGLNDGHSDADADGVVQEEGNVQSSGANSESSKTSMLSMGSGGECSRPAACTDTNVTASGFYTGVDEAGGRGRGGQKEILNSFLDELRAEIERRKTYPPFARMNGIEGTAYLNFHIGDNGRPDGIMIEKSSGSKILDESAIRTLKGMERFYPVPEEIRDLEITVPIAYRLVEDAEKINR